MAKKLFITATNTNIGKTYASIKILKKLGSLGVKIGAIKPIETGVSNIPQDAKELLTVVKQYNNNFQNFKPQDICTYSFALPAAPFCATKKEINIAKIEAKISQLESLCDFLLIEGAGGLMVPINKDFFMIDLIKKLNTPALLVTPSHLGCINETMLSLNILQNANIKHNWCINLYKEKQSFHTTTKPFYNAYFKNWQYLDEFVDSLDIQKL
jgi:dethiobiotin synthetase